MPGGEDPPECGEERRPRPMPRRPAPVTGPRRGRPSPAVKVRWHRDFPIARTPRDSCWESDEFSCSGRRPAPVRRRARPRRRLGTPSASPEVRHVRRGQGPLRARASGAPRGRATGGNRGGGARDRDGEPARARRRRADRAGPDDTGGGRPAPAVRPLPARGHGVTADDPRPRSGGVAASFAEGALRRVRGRCAGLSVHFGRHGVHGGAHAEDRGVGDRVGRERVRHRLLRPSRLPRAVAAVLQAGAGRRVRTRLRGRPGLPRRAARHRPPPRAVHQPGRRTGVRPGPPRRHGRPARSAGRDGATRRWSPSPPRSRRSTSPRRWNSSVSRRTSSTSPPPTSGRCRSGRGASTGRSSCS